MVAQSRAGLKRKESVPSSSAPGQGIATIPHANGSGAAADPPAVLQPLTQTASREEVPNVQPDSTAPDAEDAWHTVVRRPSAAGKDPRAAMAAVRAQLQVTRTTDTCTCPKHRAPSSQLPLHQSFMVYGVPDDLATAARCTISKLPCSWRAGQCKCGRRGRAAGARHAAAPRGGGAAEKQPEL